MKFPTMISCNHHVPYGRQAILYNRQMEAYISVPQLLYVLNVACIYIYMERHIFQRLEPKYNRWCAWNAVKAA